MSIVEFPTVKRVLLAQKIEELRRLDDSVRHWERVWLLVIGVGVVVAAAVLVLGAS